mgnify:CR=1 FL=1
METPQWYNDTIKFSCFSITIDGKGKKQPSKLPKEWNLLTKSVPTKKNHKIQCILTGDKSGITVIDFDNMESFNKVREMIPEEELNIVKTRRGVHAYFKYNEEIISSIPRSKRDEFNVDIMNNNKFIFAPPSTYIVEGETYTYSWKYQQPTLFDIPEDLIAYINNFKNEPDAPPAKIETKSDKLKIVELIDVKYIADRKSWLKIVFAMFTEDFSLEEIYKISLKAEGKCTTTTMEELEYMWDNLNEDSKKCTMGTLKHYALLSNPVEYKLLTENYNYFLNNNNKFLSQLFSLLNKDGIYYIPLEDAFYYWRGDRWGCDDTRPFEKLAGYIIISLNEFYEKLEKIISNKQPTDDDEENEYNRKLKVKCADLIYHVGMNVNITNIRNIFVREMIETSNHKPFFDKNIYTIGFKDCKFDLLTKKKSKIERDDFITMSTNKELEDYDETKVKVISDLVDSIFPDPEVKRCYISVLYSCLRGGQKQKFIIANGSGGNGKGLLHELMLDLLGDYGLYSDGSLLQSELKAQGASPEIANLHKKRMVIYPEPSKAKPIVMSTVKKLVSTTNISARTLYSKASFVYLVGTHIVEANSRCDFDSEPTDGEARRLIDVLFAARFVDKQDPAKYEKYKNLGFHVGWADEKYKSYEFKQEYMIPLFWYLVKNIHQNDLKDIYVPEVVKERTLEYININKDGENFLEETISRIDEPDKDNIEFISLKVLWNEYKREINNKILYHKFVKTVIEENDELKNFYRKKYEYTKNGKKTSARNVLLHHKFNDISLEQGDDDD